MSSTTTKTLFSHSAERNLIIAFLTLEDAVLEAQSELTTNEFYYTPYKNIAAVCFDLFNNGKEMSLVSIENELVKRKQFEDLQGENDLWQLSSEISHGTIENNAKIVRTYYKRRETLRILQKSIQEVYNESVEIETTIENTQNLLIAIDAKNDKETKSFGELRGQTLERAKKMKEARLNGTKSDLMIPKLQSLAKIIKGYGKGQLIIVAARPGIGKTVFAVDEGVYLAKQGYKGVIFSFEISSEDMTGRVLANLSKNTYYSAISTGFLNKEEEDELLIAGTGIENNLYIHSSAAVSVEKLRGIAIKLKIKYGIDYIIVDYLQLMSSSEAIARKGNTESEISAISNNLKRIAMELDIPVIALSQLSRDNEKRGGDRRPVLSDLRGSGSLEQDGNKIFFLHRPEYYGITEYEGGVSTLGVTEVIVAKNREGATGTAMADSSQIPMSRLIDFPEGHFKDEPNF